MIAEVLANAGQHIRAETVGRQAEAVARSIATLAEQDRPSRGRVRSLDSSRAVISASVWVRVRGGCQSLAASTSLAAPMSWAASLVSVSISSSILLGTINLPLFSARARSRARRCRAISCWRRT